MEIFSRIFGRYRSPDELLKEWKSNIKSQQRELDKQIRGIIQQETTIKSDIKLSLKKSNSYNEQGIRILAKELIRSQHAKDRLLTAKTQLDSILMQLSEQAALIRVSGVFQKSTEVTKAMNASINLPQLSHNMMNLQKEMIRAGLVDEILSEAVESKMDTNMEIEEEEIQDVIDSILVRPQASLVSQARPVPSAIPQSPKPLSNISMAEYNTDSNDIEKDVEIKAMQARLQSLR